MSDIWYVVATATQFVPRSEIIGVFRMQIRHQINVIFFGRVLTNVFVGKTQQLMTRAQMKEDFA
jgi:hypothetical protein